VILPPIGLPLKFLMFPNLSGLGSAENLVKSLFFLLFINDSLVIEPDSKSGEG